MVPFPLSNIMTRAKVATAMQLSNGYHVKVVLTCSWLSPNQLCLLCCRVMYDRSSDLWQMLFHICSGLGPGLKRSFWGQFFSGQMRFYRQMLMAAKVCTPYSTWLLVWHLLSMIDQSVWQSCPAGMCDPWSWTTGNPLTLANVGKPLLIQ